MVRPDRPSAAVPARVPLRRAQRRGRAVDHRRPPRGRGAARWSPTRSSSTTAARASRCRGVGRLRYVVSPDHRHWHLLRFERYELRRPAARRARRATARPGSASATATRVTGRALPARAAEPVVHEPLRAGAARAARDPRRDLRRLRRRLRGQPRGPVPPADRAPRRRYVLVHRVNGDRRIQESGYGNNAASVRCSPALARRASRTSGSSSAAPAARAATVSRSRGSDRVPGSSDRELVLPVGPRRGRSAGGRLRGLFPPDPAGGHMAHSAPHRLPALLVAGAAASALAAAPALATEGPTAPPRAPTAARRRRAADVRAVPARHRAARRRAPGVIRGRGSSPGASGAAARAARVSLAAPSRLRVVITRPQERSPHRRGRNVPARGKRRLGAPARPLAADTRSGPAATAISVVAIDANGTRSRPVQPHADRAPLAVETCPCRARRRPRPARAAAPMRQFALHVMTGGATLRDPRPARAAREAGARAPAATRRPAAGAVPPRLRAGAGPAARVRRLRRSRGTSTTGRARSAPPRRRSRSSRRSRAGGTLDRATRGEPRARASGGCWCRGSRGRPVPARSASTRRRGRSRATATSTSRAARRTATSALRPRASRASPAPSTCATRTR